MTRWLFLFFTVALTAVGNDEVFRIDFKSDSQLKLERLAFYRYKNGAPVPIYLAGKNVQRKVISGRPNGRRDKREGTLTFDALNAGIKGFRYVKCDMLLHKRVFATPRSRLNFTFSADAVKYQNFPSKKLQKQDDAPGDFIKCSMLLDARKNIRCLRIGIKPVPLQNSLVQITGITVSSKPFAEKKIRTEPAKQFFSGRPPCYRLNGTSLKMADFLGRQLTSPAELEKTSFSDFWGEVTLPEKHTTFKYPGCKKAMRSRGIPCLGFAYKADIIPVFDPAKERILLKFVRSSFVTEIFIDGRPAGKSVESGLPLEFDITDHIVSGKKSSIFIRTTGYAAGVLDKNGRGKFPHSGRNNVGGIARNVVLEKVPAVRCNMLEAAPGKGKVTLQAAVVNETASDVSTQLFLMIRDKSGKIIFKTAASLEIPSKASKKFRHTFDVKDELELWDIGKPALYFAEAQTKNNVTEEYCKRERFGYRYVNISGEDFYLNGRKIRLRGPWGHLEDWVRPRLDVRTRKRDNKAEPADIYRKLMKYGMNCGRLHRQIFPPEYYSQADETGFLIIAESAFGHVWLPENEVKNHLVRFVKNFRNHPSVVIWSASNEFQLWVTPRPQKAMDFLNRLDNVIKSHDLTCRPVQHSGFGDANGRSDICNVHYPCDLKGLPEKLYWTRNPLKLTRYSYHDNFNRFNPKGKKPLFYGEHFNAHIIRDMHSAESGEDGLKALYRGYNNHFESTESQRLTGEVWRRHIRAAREQNVAMISPIVFYCGIDSEYICEISKEFKPQGAYPVFPMPVFEPGTVNTRKFVAFEDDGFAFNGKMTVTLKGKKQYLLAEKAISLAGGEIREFDLDLDIPDTTGEFTCVTTLSNSAGKTLYQDETPVKLRRRSEPADLQLSCGVWGNPAPISSFAQKHGVVLRKIDPDKLTGNILLVMPDVPEEALSERAGRLSQYIFSGAKVLFFERKWNKSILPGDIVFSNYNSGSGRGFIRSPEHPALAGMSDRDFFVWKKNLVLAEQGMLKSSAGNISVLVDGATALEHAFLWELRYGRGCAMTCHLPLAEYSTKLPQGEQLLLNILKYFKTKQRALHTPSLLAGGSDDFAGVFFHSLGCRSDSPDREMLIVTGNAVEKLGVSAVCAKARQYKRVFLFNTPKNSVAALAKGLQAPPIATGRENRKKITGVPNVWLSEDPHCAYRGISSGDLSWNSGIAAEYIFMPSSEWKNSISPGRDAVWTRSDGFTICFINLAFDRDVTLSAKKRFFASQLINNTNGLISMRGASDRLPQNERYFSVSLSDVANASRKEILPSFPSGNIEFDGIPFQVPAESRKVPKSMLRLNGREKSMKAVKVKFDTPWDKFNGYPGVVKITLPNPQFESISFLMTSTYNWKLRKNDKGNLAAKIRLTYRDGTRHEVSIKVGTDVPDGRKSSAVLTRGKIVADVPIAVNASGETAKIGIASFTNPHPEKKISKFEIEAADNPPRDLLIFGITCERTAKEYI